MAKEMRFTCEKMRQRNCTLGGEKKKKYLLIFADYYRSILEICSTLIFQYFEEHKIVIDRIIIIWNARLISEWILMIQMIRINQNWARDYDDDDGVGGDNVRTAMLNNNITDIRTRASTYLLRWFVYPSDRAESAVSRSHSRLLARLNMHAYEFTFNRRSRQTTHT